MNTSLPSRPDRPLPFTPSDIPAVKLLIRAVAAHAVAAARGPSVSPGEISRQFWGRDAATFALIERAATAPATTVTAGWAAELAAKATGAFIGNLQDSAAAALIGAAPRFTMSGIYTLALPRASSTGGAAWVGEGSPIVIPQAAFVAAPTLGPVKKVAIAEVITRELSEASPDDVEGIIEIILKDSITRTLDLTLFDSLPSTAVRPAGLTNGLTPVTAATGGGHNAALGEVRSLVDAAVLGGGSGAVMFFTSSGRATALLAYAPALAGRVFGSASIASTTLIAVDPRAFASALGDAVEIRASKETILHMEDTSPVQIGTVGTPNVVAAPTRAMFQTDSIAIRVIMRMAWALRVPAVSFISTGMTW
jgi:hypothetical protein